MSGPSTLRRTILICALLALATSAAYQQVLRHEFVNYDDDVYVTGNVRTRAGLTWPGIAWAFTTFHGANWHPVTWLSHMVDLEIFGLKPWGHHLVNLVLHVLNTLLLFYILSQITGFLWRSAFVAALFALHPLHVESVAWVAERKDVLSAAFWLLTMLAYVSYVYRPSIRRYLLVVLVFALGLMAKPMLVTLPFALLLLDYWPLGRMYPSGNLGPAPREAASERRKGRSRRNQKRESEADGQLQVMSAWRLVSEKLPLFVLAAISCGVTCLAQQKGGALGAIEHLPLGVRTANALVSSVQYIGKMLYPAHLAVFYPHPGGALPIWEAVAAGMVLAAITAAVLRLRVRRRYLVTGWLWYLGTLVPVLGLVQVGWQSMADRYTYIPLIGVFVVIAWGVPDLVSRHESFFNTRLPAVSRTPVYILSSVAGAVIMSSALITCRQLACWQNSVTLFRHAIAVTRCNCVAECNLGSALERQGRLRDAIECYRKALEINPRLASAHFNMGSALEKLGKVSEAIREYEAAIRIKPADVGARTNLGAVLCAQGRVEEAIPHFLTALKAGPDSARAHYNLGLAYEQSGDLLSATEEYACAERICPNDPDVHFRQGAVLLRSGDIDGATREYREAIRLRPGFAEAHADLANALRRDSRFAEAISEYEVALRLKPDSGILHNNLAVALYLRGDYAEAWKEVVLARRCGYEPHPGFLRALAQACSTSVAH